MDFWLALMSKVLPVMFSVTQGDRSLSALPAGKAQGKIYICKVLP